MAEQHEPSQRAEYTPEIDRRCFLKAGLAAIGTMVAGSLLRAGAAASPPMTSSDADEIPRKPLGKTGVHVSIIALGGYHLGTMPSLDDAVRLVQEAVDAGVTFVDNAWEYNEHRSKEWMGRALQGRRQSVPDDQGVHPWAG
jgi:hypothetical protein